MNKKTFTAAFGITSAMVMGYVGFNNIVFAEEIEEPAIIEESTDDTFLNETSEIAMIEEEFADEQTALMVQEDPTTETKKTTLVKFVTKADDTKTYQTDVDMELVDENGNTVATWTSKEGPTELVLGLGNYTLKVVNAPEGYIPGKSIDFSISEDDILSDDEVYRMSYDGYDLEDSNGNVYRVYCLNKNRKIGTTEHPNYSKVVLSAQQLESYLTNTKKDKIEDIEVLKKEILKVVYNGGPNDLLGLKEKYGVTDVNMRNYTQTAVWKLTNGDGKPYENPKSTYDLCVNELMLTDNYAPDNLDFLVYETSDLDYQHIVSAIVVSVRMLEVLNLKEIPILTSKVDEQNNPLAGAVIEIVDEDGDVVASYTSTADLKELVLGAGVYTMRETQAPEGYELAKDIIFRVLTDGTVEIQDGDQWIAVDGNTLVMIDLLLGYEEVDEPEIKPETAMDLNLEMPKDIKKPKDNKKPSIPGVPTGVASSISTILSLMSLSMVGAIRFKKEM